MVLESGNRGGCHKWKEYAWIPSRVVWGVVGKRYPTPVEISSPHRQLRDIFKHTGERIWVLKFALNYSSLVAGMVKCLPAMRETQIQSLGQKDPLEKEKATHCSILAWKIPWTEEPGRLQSMWSQRVGHNWATSLSLFHFHSHKNCGGDFPGGPVAKNLPAGAGNQGLIPSLRRPHMPLGS